MQKQKKSRKKGEPIYTVVGQTTVKKAAAYLIFGKLLKLRYLHGTNFGAIA